MNNKVFIPVTDEMLYEHPEWITAPLCPYQVDNPCFHWMASIDLLESGSDKPKVKKHFTYTMYIENAIGNSSHFGTGSRLA